MISFPLYSDNIVTETSFVVSCVASAVRRAAPSRMMPPGRLAHLPQYLAGSPEHSRQRHSPPTAASCPC